MKSGGLIAVATAVVAGCSSESPKPVPEPPATVLTRPERSPWGDQVAARVGRLANHVEQVMADRYGTVAETGYVGSDPAAVAGLEEWYRTQLGKGWSPVPIRMMPGEHGFGFANGARAVVVGWIDPLPDGRVPVTVFSYGER